VGLNAVRIMGIVDRIKNLKSQAEDLWIPQRVVFHHVPKCGGTSVGRGLRKRYLLSQATVTPESSFRAFEAFTGRTDRERMLVDVLDMREQMMLYLLFEDVRCVSLHVRFSTTAYEKFSDRYKFITVLREPVARFISHYNWSHGKPQAHARIDEDFDAFLETERARRLGATFVEYYAGLPKEANLRSDAAIAAAIANLRKFSVVGDIGDVPLFERDLRRELGVRVRVRHENKVHSSRQFISASKLPEPTLEKVRALCAPDLQVWKDALADRSRAAGGDLAQREARA
jgi:hypothetical protein